jgi:hypothetical protein
VYRKDPEKRTQDIFALGDPRNGFDVKRMDSEQRSNHCAFAKAAGHPIDSTEQQQAIRDMENDTRYMMSACAQSIQLDVEHMRNPCERMPISRCASGERPLDTIPRDTPQDVCIFDDILSVVQVNEFEVSSLRVHHRYQYGNRHADCYNWSGEERTPNDRLGRADHTMTRLRNRFASFSLVLSLSQYRSLSRVESGVDSGARDSKTAGQLSQQSSNLHQRHLSRSDLSH